MNILERLKEDFDVYFVDELWQADPATYAVRDLCCRTVWVGTIGDFVRRFLTLPPPSGNILHKIAFWLRYAANAIRCIKLFKRYWRYICFIGGDHGIILLVRKGINVKVVELGPGWQWKELQQQLGHFVDFRAELYIVHSWNALVVELI